jgi:hypothetical protein
VRQALGIADEPDPLDPHLSSLDENDPFTTNLCVLCDACCRVVQHHSCGLHWQGRTLKGHAPCPPNASGKATNGSASVMITLQVRWQLGAGRG